MATAKRRSAREDFARACARAEGLLADKGAPRSVRIPPRLLEAAREKLGVEGTTEIVTTALARVVYDDRFGEHLLVLKGRASKGFMATLEAEWAEGEPRP